MLRSLLFSVSLVCALTSQIIPQTPPKLTEEDKLDRQFHDLTELAGPLKSVVLEEAQFSTRPNESGQYVEEGREHVKTVFLDKDGKVTGTLPRSRRFKCGNNFSDESKRTELYDARGEKKGMIEEYFNSDGRLLARTIYEYDSGGQTRAYSLAIYNVLGSIEMKVSSKYDAQGNHIERSTYGKYGVLTSRDVYIRNEKGLVVESLEYRSTDPRPARREAMSYEYDDFGNWIKSSHSKFVTEDGVSFFKPVRVKYRTIAYYSQDGEK